MPRWTLTVTLAVGLGLARLALATTGDGGAAVLGVGLTLELGALGWLALRGRRAHRAWRAARARGEATVDALTAAFGAARLPARLAEVLASELTLATLVVVGWRRPIRSAAVFTVHLANGWPTYAGVLVFLTVVETSLLHLVLAAYVSTTLAWVASGLSGYGVLWVIGDALALRHGGVILDDDGLTLRVGVRWRGRVPWATVAAVGPYTPGQADVDASILGANVVLALTAPCRLVGLLGRRREGCKLALSVDARDDFVAAVTQRLRGASSWGVDAAPRGVT
jgi:hypothetical protein